MNAVSGALVPLAVTWLLMTSSGAEGLRVVDLTYELKEGASIAWPIYPPYNFTILTRGHSNAVRGAWLESNHISVAEHTGTHIDAPSHLARGKWRMHQIPASRLVGPGVVVDVTQQVNNNPDYAVSVQDLEDWEARFGRIPNGAVVLMRSGWGRRYPDQRRVFNTQNTRDTSTFHFPGFSGEAAQWLADNRDITALGGDTPSPDVAQDNTFPVHRILLGKEIMILENVARLELMPVTGTLVVMGALNIYDGSGSPMRLLALADFQGTVNSDNSAGHTTTTTSPVFALLALALLRLLV